LAGVINKHQQNNTKIFASHDPLPDQDLKVKWMWHQ